MTRLPELAARARRLIVAVEVHKADAAFPQAMIKTPSR